MSFEKKILVKAYLNYNLGDDLFISILLERYPNIKFNLITLPDYTAFKNYNNYKCIGKPINKFERIFANIVKLFSKQLYTSIYSNLYRKFYSRQMKKNEAYIVIGGSMFKESKNSNTIIEIEKNILRTLINKKTFIIGVNFGPFTNINFYKSYLQIFPLYDDICFRDKYSYNLFKKLNNVRISKDIVFQLKLPDVEIIPNTIGIVVTDFSIHENLNSYKDKYENCIETIIKITKELGYKITLYGFEKKEKKYIENLQSKFSKNIGIDISSIIYSGDIDKFLLSYLNQSIIFATRFHSMILSFMKGQKVCPIIYNQKLNNFLDDIGYNGFKIEMDGLMVARKDIISFILNETYKLNYTECYSQQFAVLDKFINKIS